jgi:hypothetical protein
MLRCTHCNSFRCCDDQLNPPYHQNPGPAPTQVATPTSLTIEDPTNSGGARARFTLVATDLDGGTDITHARLRIAANANVGDPVGACEIGVLKATGYLFFIMSDTGQFDSTTLANSRCRLNPTSSSVVIAGDTLTATFDVQFLLPFRNGQAAPNQTPATYNVYASVKETTLPLTTWLYMANHTVTGAPARFHSVTPNQGGPSNRQIFTFDIREPFGEAALTDLYFLFVTNLFSPGCSGIYNPRTNGTTIALYRYDTSTWESQALSTNMNLSNGYCTLRSATYAAAPLGATLVLDVEFAATFGGSRTWFGGGNNSYQFPSWTTLGTWTVPEISTFNLTGPSGTVNATIAQQKTVDFAVAYTGGFNAPVSFQVSGLPANTNPTFTPNSVTASQSATLRFTPLAAGTYPVIIRATGGTVQKELAFNVVVLGPAVMRSLDLPAIPTGSANTDQLSGITRLTGLTSWHADTRLHHFSGNTSRQTIWSFWGTVPLVVDLDPSTSRLRLISVWEYIGDARDCSVSYAGRTDILIRVERANTGQYSLQVWNADGSNFAASTPANCTGTAGNQNIDYRLIIGGWVYGQPGIQGGIAYWRLRSGLGSGAADPPTNTPPAALLAYEFEQQTLAEAGGGSPAGPTLIYSNGIGYPPGTAVYRETPP